MKVKLILLLTFISICICHAQEVRFVNSYSKAIKIANETNKKVFIDFYTVW